VSDAVNWRCAGSNPNIEMEKLQGVSGKPPIMNRPASSVTVSILSVPQIAVTVAPGIGWPPDRTTPLSVAPNASPPRIKANTVTRIIPRILYSNSPT
jgi:hypothetical protein